MSNGNRRNLPPELAAAVHAHIDYRTRYLGGPQTSATLNRVADAALHYCELMTYEQNYIPTSVGQLGRAGKVTNLFLFVGAQARDILASRVRAGVRLLGELTPAKTTIVFSGRNPVDAGFGRAQPDEAVQMEALFNKAVVKQGIPKKRRENGRLSLRTSPQTRKGTLKTRSPPRRLEATRPGSTSSARPSTCRGSRD